MITLEEKLSQFEELINTKVDRENKLKLEEKQQEISAFLNNEKSMIEDNAKRSAKLSMDRINRNKQEIISTVIQEEKRDILKLSEGFIKTLTLKIEDKCREFTLGEAYPKFITQILMKTLLNESVPKENHVKIILASANFNETKGKMTEDLKSNGYMDCEIIEGDINYLGGFVIEIPQMNLRITKTLENAISNKRDDIGQFMQNYVRDGGTN